MSALFDRKQKRTARDAVYRAVKAGRLKRQPCEQCGRPGNAHHDDYSKPLNVRWFCPRHHGLLHRAANITTTMSSQIRVRVSGNTKRGIERIAARMKVSTSDLLRETINAFLAKIA